MAGSTQVTRTYPITDFPNTDCNTAIFKQEIADDPTVTTTPQSVIRSGAEVVVVFASLILAAEVAALDALVAAHQGSDFNPTFQKAQNTEIVEATDATLVESVALDTGVLPAGNYQIAWVSEVRLDSTANNTGAKATLSYAKNGGTAAEGASHTTDLNAYQQFSGSYSQEIADGESIQIGLLVSKVGAGAVTAQIRKCRLSVIRVAGSSGGDGG